MEKQLRVVDSGCNEERDRCGLAAVRRERVELRGFARAFEQWIRRLRER